MSRRPAVGAALVAVALLLPLALAGTRYAHYVEHLAVQVMLMGLYAKLPFAVAPGMGINAFFTYTIVLGKGVPWPAALGIIFWAGVLFLLGYSIERICDRSIVDLGQRVVQGPRVAARLRRIG